MSQNDDGYGRALANGYLWLNDIFVAKAPKHRLFRRLSVRLSIVEVALISLVTLIASVVLYGLGSFFSSIPGLDSIAEGWTMALLGPVLGWFGGRKLAKASPYQRATGEGIGAYLFVQADSKSWLLGRLVGRRVAVNRCVTMVTGKRLVVDCVEWIGTARAPRMPHFDPDTEQYTAEVVLQPRNRPVGWVDQMGSAARRRRELEGVQ